MLHLPKLKIKPFFALHAPSQVQKQAQTLGHALKPVRYPTYSRRCAARQPAGKKAGLAILWLKRTLSATMDTVAEKAPNTSEHRERNARSQLIKLRVGSDPALRTRPESGGRIWLQEIMNVEKKVFNRTEGVEWRRSLGHAQDDCLAAGRSCAYCRVICGCMVPPGALAIKAALQRKLQKKT